jgi:NitT/TauT family transport system permease protein
MTTGYLAALLAGGGGALWGLSRGEGWAARVGTPVLFGALFLAGWELACAGYQVPRIMLPPPSAIGGAFLSHLPTLGADFMQTVLRSVLPGYVIGCGAGLLAAIGLDRSDFLRRGVMPLGSLVSAMPIVGIAPIMVMWFGFDWPSKAAVVTVMTFFPMLIQATAGLAAAGAMERDLMRSYGASYRATLFRLRLPAAVPFIFVAVKLNATLALIGAIVAEFFGTPVVGIGFRISTEVARMNLDLVWAEIALASLTGTLAFAGLSLLERSIAFWHPSFR